MPEESSDKQREQESKKRKVEETKKREDYAEDYRLFMKGKRRETIPNRLRWLSFAVIDPDCPLESISSVAEVMKLIHIHKSSDEKVRREMFKMSHRLGLLKANNPVKLDPRIPGPNEFAEILAFRKQMELSALFRLHHDKDVEHRATTIRLLRTENGMIGGVNTSCQKLDIENLIAKKADIGFLAELFWKHDTTLHILPSQMMAKPDPKPSEENAKSDSNEPEEEEPIQVSILRMLLARMRLSDSNRLVILRRIGKSHREHEAIINAVESKAVDPPNEVTHDYQAGREVSTSEQSIIDEVEEHFLSFKHDFSKPNLRLKSEGESGKNL